MTTAPQRIAALDLGTNSFHLVVAEVVAGALRTVTSEKAMLRLGDEVGATGEISILTEARAIDAVQRLIDVARAQGAQEIVAAATAAVREARNGAAFVDELERRTGVGVEVISGEREARLIFRAVQAALDFGGAHVLGIDIGGGSVEFMVGDQRSCDLVASVPLGVGRLTARFPHADPMTRGERRALDAHVREVLAPVADEADLYAHELAVATSGTLLAMGRILADEDGAPDRPLGGMRIDADRLVALCRRLARSDAAERSRIASLEARRADLMPAAGVLVKAIIETFAIETVALCTWGLREGLVLQRVEHPAVASANPERARGRSVLALGRRMGFDELHGRTTERLAWTLFDAFGAGLGLDARHRELLGHAAVIHDIGNAINRKAHHRHGAYLVRHSELAGFEPADRTLLVALVRFHRSGNPRPGRDEVDELSAADAAALPALVALLRVADGLDSSRHGNVLGLDVRADAGTALIRLTSTSGDPGLDLWGARRKAPLLEEVLGKQVVLVGPDEPIDRALT